MNSLLFECNLLSGWDTFYTPVTKTDTVPDTSACNPASQHIELLVTLFNYLFLLCLCFRNWARVQMFLLGTVTGSWLRFLVRYTESHCTLEPYTTPLTTSLHSQTPSPLFTTPLTITTNIHLFIYFYCHHWNEFAWILHRRKSAEPLPLSQKIKLTSTHIHVA